MWWECKRSLRSEVTCESENIYWPRTSLQQPASVTLFLVAPQSAKEAQKTKTNITRPIIRFAGRSFIYLFCLSKRNRKKKQQARRTKIQAQINNISSVEKLTFKNLTTTAVIEP